MGSSLEAGSATSRRAFQALLVLHGRSQKPTITKPCSTQAWHYSCPELLCIQVELPSAVTAMAWHPDGSKLCIGTASGGLDMYDAHRPALAYGADFQVAHGLAGGVTVMSNGAFCPCWEVDFAT